MIGNDNEMDTSAFDAWAPVTAIMRQLCKSLFACDSVLADNCDADKAANNIVPIAVGAALAVLVIIVLVLYLIGRRKHQKGYQTV